MTTMRIRLRTSLRTKTRKLMLNRMRAERTSASPKHTVQVRSGLRRAARAPGGGARL